MLDRSADLIPAKSSKEAHAKQKAVSKERKLSKPNADSIHRAKKIWERLRRKSHVPKEERQALVKELFEIISGRVRDFVFKHDAVRTVQCALKYANPEQTRTIAKELKGEYKVLAESRYGKFLAAKILVKADKEMREMIISEFYGHVKRLINHPEAAWILDDTYRGLATPKQKAILLREWYAPEYSVFKTSFDDGDPTSDLHAILTANPEKRLPVIQHLHHLINQLVQKKVTGFTMLHDAMLQYSLAVGTPSEDNTTANEFLELLKSDLNDRVDDNDDQNEGGDLLKNLAFTPSGSRVVCRALATSSAKDRKIILRVYRDHIETVACNAHAHQVLLTAYEVIDDTVMTAKVVFPELLASKLENVEERYDAIAALAVHPNGRIPLLYPLASGVNGPAKWLLNPTSPPRVLLQEVRSLRGETSRKDPEKRRTELVRALTVQKKAAMLSTIAHRADGLMRNTFGCQFVAETLLATDGSASDRVPAMEAVADCAAGDPRAEDHIIHVPTTCRTLKTLALGGQFDTESKQLVKPDSKLQFAGMLWQRVKEHLVHWATGEGSFVVVALTETAEDEYETEGRYTILEALKGIRSDLQGAAENGYKGAKLLLEKAG